MTEAPPALVPLDQLLATVVPSARLLVEAGRLAGLSTRVPSCPDWDVEALVAHTGGVHRWVVATLDAGGPVPNDGEWGAPVGEAIFDWFEEGAAGVVAALSALGVDGSAWNFARQAPTAGFWFRRQAHETAMHAVDAQLAAGTAPTMDAALAADGIDEMLFPLVGRVARRRVAAADGEAMPAALGTLHLHCTDVDGEWLIEGGDDWSALAVTRTHAKGDAALRGPALDVLLHLTNRAATAQIVGDQAVVARWSQAMQF